MDYCPLCRTQSRPLKKDLLIFQCNKRRKVLGKDFLYRKERGESKKSPQAQSFENNNDQKRILSL